MLKGYIKWIVAVIILAALIISLLWTEGFGLFPKYQYGKTGLQALNYSYQKGTSDVGHVIDVTTIDIDESEKLVLYISPKNTFTYGLVRKKWNNNWSVTAQGKELPFNLDPSYKFIPNPPLICTQEDMKKFRISYGIIFDRRIEKITVGDKDALLLRKEFGNPVWYLLDKLASSNTADDSKSEVKAYDKNQKLIYSYNMKNN